MEAALSVPDLSEVCIAGRELSEFSVRKIGSNVRKLDLSFNTICRLSGLETCAETLEELILDNNQLETLEMVTVFPRLHTISLNKNRIWSLSKLLIDLTRKVPNLRYVSLLGNPLCPDQLTDDTSDDSDYQVYRYHVLHHLRSLQFLDHKQVLPHEQLEAQKELYAKVVLHSSKLTPLVPTRRGPNVVTPGGKSKQGKKRFKYLGKNSEGNRFIKDDDL